MAIMPPAAPIWQPPTRWTEAKMLGVLHQQYQTKMVTAVVPHAPLGFAGSENGFHHARISGDATATIRYIDALILFRDKRWAVEIKVTRADLRRELANPDKTVAWRGHTHSFYYFVSPDLADAALTEVPKDTGVMTVEGSHFTKILRRSPINREPLDLPYDTWRRISRRHGRMVLGGSV